MYANGQYPLSDFIHRGGNLYFTPSLNARWDQMVRLGVEKYGVRLFVTGDIDGLGGWNVYRPLLAQRRYKAFYGIRAAAEGKSSHGGRYGGQEVFAVDVANVDALAPGNQSLAYARLAALAKAVGLTVNFVTPTEWWHVGDFNPAWSAPVFGAVAVNPNTTNRPEPEDEEDDMKPLLMQIKHANGTEPWYVVDYAAGTAARMREGIQLDLARDYGRVVSVGGMQPESAIRGLTILNG